MKKSIFLSALAVLAAASVSVFVYMKNETSPMDELFEANVEALASGESGNHSICYSSSVVKVGYTYYDCQSCSKVYDEKGTGTYSKCFQ